jgi:hypothetical protein
MEIAKLKIENYFLNNLNPIEVRKTVIKYFRFENY